MDNPTDNGQPSQPRGLLQYETWADGDGFHARLFQKLPQNALDYGCVQEVRAATETELTQEATRNRVKVWAWEASQGRSDEDRGLSIWTGDAP
ncbi:hypothetical protein [Nonomuraea basaltis]|uniref:hypothetical protein n=1 Tax=Nonomuraea basaltis TaxID=2495887 RepID=UPI00110C4D0F|nr:hypothetical protein [Nonomuraea basaltis]TMS00222.1 hypothetical protein EJK15_03870 [Nonomuraea basaltis]